jgi:hypothetical protein
MEKEAERRELEKSIYEACHRSLEGCDFLVSAFVQALNSYRRSSGKLFRSAGMVNWPWRPYTCVCVCVKRE